MPCCAAPIKLGVAGQGINAPMAGHPLLEAPLCGFRASNMLYTAYIGSGSESPAPPGAGSLPGAAAPDGKEAGAAQQYEGY